MVKKMLKDIFITVSLSIILYFPATFLIYKIEAPYHFLGDYFTYMHQSFILNKKYVSFAIFLLGIVITRILYYVFRKIEEYK